MLPRWLAFYFIPKQFHAEMKELIQAGSYTNSIYYTKGDGALERRLRHRKSQLGHIKRFLRYNKKPTD